jgi:hypothetical protein
MQTGGAARGGQNAKSPISRGRIAKENLKTEGKREKPLLTAATRWTLHPPHPPLRDPPKRDEGG